MSTASRARRKRDKDIQRAAANRRIGHDLAYEIMFGPALIKAGFVLLLAAAAVWVWFNVDHTRLAGVVGGAGVLVLVVYGAWVLRGTSVQARQMARASGVTERRRYWHMTGAAGVLLVVAAVALVQS
jgi:hypothetical protein